MNGKNSGKILNLTGQNFGRLTAVKISGRDKSGKIQWECLCSCGNTISTNANSLRRGNTQSCGCLRLEQLKAACVTHGMSNTSLYNVYTLMKSRCLSPNCKQFSYYGGRGVKVCDRWLESFENFLEDMLDGYQENLELDRKDNDGNYCKENCRWVTIQQNQQNTRSKSGSTSKYKGVSWNKKSGKWQVSIGLNGNRYLGMFSDENTAALVYNEKAKELFGEYCNLNIVKESGFDPKEFALDVKTVHDRDKAEKQLEALQISIESVDELGL